MSTHEEIIVQTKYGPEVVPARVLGFFAVHREVVDEATFGERWTMTVAKIGIAVPHWWASEAEALEAAEEVNSAWRQLGLSLMRACANTGGCCARGAVDPGSAP